MKPAARPVDFNPLRIRLPISGWVSLLHRISGVLLFTALPPAAAMLALSLADEDGFQRAAGWLAHPLCKLALLAWLWAFAHHFCAGLRHLALDVHWGVSLADARRSSAAVLVVSSLVTLAAAWRLFG
jgi:succinate dehydrogenase / fumarate reductase cytochrome b subunit